MAYDTKPACFGNFAIFFFQQKTAAICSVPLCKNADTDYVYRLPLGPIRRAKWIKSLKLDATQIGDDFCVCRQHFTEHDFLRGMCVYMKSIEFLYMRQ